MFIEKELLEKIYNRLGDDLSKEIFANRLMYSMTDDIKWIHKILRKESKQKKFIEDLYELSKEKEMVIFGAGFWGQNLYKITSDLSWKCFIDNNPKKRSFEDLKIVGAKDFFENYNNEMVVISSRIFYEEIYKQCCTEGIPEENIINAGQLIDDFSKAQYFDLEYLLSEPQKEVFVDVGAFDGQTSIQFANWCSTLEKSVYAFEPDMRNRELCECNLKSCGVAYKIIPKGAWDCEDVLQFQEAANGTSTINGEGSKKIEVTSLDHVLGNEVVTFIKMDIEGAELKALVGAEQVIKSNKPKLAISIYHKPEDIWELPNIILSYHSDYKLYLRHYSITDAETVLYAI